MCLIDQYIELGISSLRSHGFAEFKRLVPLPITPHLCPYSRRCMVSCKDGPLEVFYSPILTSGNQSTTIIFPKIDAM